MGEIAQTKRRAGVCFGLRTSRVRVSDCSMVSHTPPEQLRSTELRSPNTYHDDRRAIPTNIGHPVAHERNGAALATSLAEFYDSAGAAGGATRRSIAACSPMRVRLRFLSRLPLIGLVNHS